MKRTIINFLAATVLTLAAASCNGTGGFGQLAMDSPEAVTKVKELVTENVSPNEWKLVEVGWTEGNSDNEKLSNNLNQGYVSVKMVKSNGQVFTQSFIGQLGWKPSDITPDHWYDEGLDYAKTTPIDASKLDPSAIVKYIDAAKKMVPAEYEFKSLGSFEITAGIPAGSSGKGEYTDKQTINFTLNVTEKGNETVSNAGTTSTIYYELHFEVDADGQLTMKEQ